MTKRVAQPVQPGLELRTAEAALHLYRNARPVTRAVEVDLGQVDGSRAYGFMSVQPDLLEDGGNRGHEDLAVGPRQPSVLAGEGVQDLDPDSAIGIGVVVDGYGVDVGLLIGPVETVDVVLATLVHVDGLFVEHGLR